MKEIKLGKSGKVAFVSDQDFEIVSRFNWTAKRDSRTGKWYAIRYPTVEGKRVWISMHRFVCGLPPGTITSAQVPDHLDGNGLNNQRENLEVISHGENAIRANRNRKRVPATAEPYL